MSDWLIVLLINNLLFVALFLWYRERCLMKIEKMQRLTMIDPLTGVYNRRFFDDAIQKASQLARRGERPFTLMLLDVDHFKKINDEYGHEIGDRILRLIADVLDATVRKADTVCRIGGEEFAIILPMTDATSAEFLAERIRNIIQQMKYADYPRLKITVSIGLAQYHPGMTTHGLYRLADHALYEAKRAGRNQVKIMEGIHD